MPTEPATDDAPSFVLRLDEVDRNDIGLVGGKGAHLGELMRIEGVAVPAGFCVTTGAFRAMLAEASSADELRRRLSQLDPDDRESIGALSAEVRRTIEDAGVPALAATAITEALGRFGDDVAYAVRSSATAEDLPSASFAGQLDTSLNVIGVAAILSHVSRCWASLFSERAVTYRLRNGFDDRELGMAVVVQHMVGADVSGVMFTADPITSNRTITTIEAAYGLGEALVSGLVNPDVYRVRRDEIVERTVADKRLQIGASSAGGTVHVDVEPDRQGLSALTDAQVLQLVAVGRRIEAHLGAPQDIEWCLATDQLHVLQSRAITTLFPVPHVHDADSHVYVSVGHQQMMTDPMRPLGLSLWQLLAARPMHAAAGRLFVDVAAELSRPSTRARVLDALGKSDPLIGDALKAIVDRGDFITMIADDESAAAPPAGAAPPPIATDPRIVLELEAHVQAVIATVRRDIQAKSGVALVDFILTNVQEMKQALFDPRSMQVVMAAMEATWWLGDHLDDWLGERWAVDTLTQAAPGNVTSEMGRALLDVADAIRPHPEVVAFLERVESDDFLDDLTSVSGGPDAAGAIRRYLDRYGMRCVGEIDVTRPRWSERPSALVPLILSNIKNFGPGAGERHFIAGRLEAEAKEAEVLGRLRALPDGEQKAAETKRMIDRVRTFIGYREYPKYGLVCRCFVYKQALMDEADRLVAAGVLGDREDIFFLTMQELREVARSSRVDEQLLQRRREEHLANQAMMPPRVLTSDGEVVTASYRRDGLPAGALVGLPVSSGTVEGRARVILDISTAELERGDILITTFTDPSWTPLFVTIGGLVTEVGGMMTHGAVIAREYGLPAVVGVERATSLIRDGQRIRVNGAGGYVEILDPS